MKATIKDVARAAQVSPSTVSRALHNNPRISEKVRERVHRVAKELDFHPNQMASSLVNRKTRIVGVVFPGSASSSMGHPFYPAVLQGLGQVAGEQSYHMLLSTGGENLSGAEAVRTLADSGYVSGLLLLAAQDSPIEELFSSQSLPVVEIGHPSNAENRYYVDNDNVKAGYTATKYLLDRGHERILFLGYNARFCVTVDRRAGYEKALEESGITLRSEWIVPSRFIQNTTDKVLLDAIFREKEHPTAVVSMDDPLSLEFMRFLKTLELAVPTDVSIVSFNNTQAGQFAAPALTTVDVDPYLLGVSAMRLLLDIINGKALRPMHIEVPFQLIQRDSVASRTK